MSRCIRYQPLPGEFLTSATSSGTTSAGIGSAPISSPKPDRDLPLGGACKHFGHGSSDLAGQLLVVEQGSTGSDVGQAASVVELVSALRQDQLG